MSKLAASAGHNAKVTGAHGFLVEHVENRRVLASLKKYTQQLGWTFADCTDDVSNSAAGIVNGAVARHLKHPDAECDVQLHFNASSGSHDRAIGVECIISTMARPKDRQRAERISDILAKNLGLPRRKTIVTDRFGFPRMTKYGIIIEVCFVNSKADATAYNKAGADAVGKWIAEAIVGKVVTAPKPKPVAPQVIKPPASSTKLGSIITKRDVPVYARPEWGTQTGAVVAKGQNRHVYARKDGWYQLFSGEWLPSQSGANFEYMPVKKPEPERTEPPDAKPSLKRVIVDGKQVGAFSQADSVLRGVSEALDGKAKTITIKDV